MSPCESSYLEPSYHEIESRKIAKHIIFIHSKIPNNLITDNWIIEASEDTYGNPHRYDELKNILNNLLDYLNKKQIENIVYNAKSRQSRSLANYYEKEYKEHVTNKKKQNKKLAKEKKLTQDYNRTLLKLRKEEVDIINNYISHITNKGE